MGELLVVLRGRRGHDQAAVDQLVAARVVRQLVEVGQRPTAGDVGQGEGHGTSCGSPVILAPCPRTSLRPAVRGAVVDEGWAVAVAGAKSDQPDLATTPTRGLA